MANRFETDPRGPSSSLLLVLGVTFLVMATAIAATLIAKSQGRLDRLVGVAAALVDVGDGLPARSDVKFRGVLVGFVTDVTPAKVGEPNLVHIDLLRRFAADIPATVTARVVPSNVFAVSSIQLVDHGPAAPLRPGTLIPEDTSLPTVLFQSTLSKLRALLASVGRPDSVNGVGALTALGEAAEGRGARLREAGGDLGKIIAQLSTVVAGDAGPSTIGALADAADSLKTLSPSLFDALDTAIKPARTLAEKRVELNTLLTQGLKTAGAVRESLDHQTDRLIAISVQLTPVMGVFADHATEFPPIATRMQRLSDKMYQIWDPRTNSFPQRQIISLTPVRQYVRADCPRYGDLLGPSCLTAPEVPTTPDLLPALGAMGYAPTPGLTENRPNFA